MKVSFHAYQLIPRGPGHPAPRNGALLRVEFAHGRTGFADCHPWPELGDLPLDRQLSDLKCGVLTPLTARSIAMAEADSIARMEHRNLFDGLTVPRSHASFPYALGQPEDWALNGSELERIHAFGFDILKVKAGDDLPAELAEITDLARWAREFEVRIRIDFNEKPSFEAVEKFLVELATATEGLDWLDWVEDPCVFDREHWRILAQQSGVRLALDRPYIRGIEAEECLGAVGVLVVKPAVSSPDAAIEFARQLGMPVAVTSYLDHAVGQVGAAWIAARALAAGVPMDECGLITHRAYEDDAFSETLGYRDARLEPPSGFGIGFDEELHRVRWEVIP